MIDGRSVEAAPISRLGVVLSQPTRQHDAVHLLAAHGFLDRHGGKVAEHHRGGRKVDSEAENTGTITGKPPAS
jgi:hypothetical protein